MESDNWLHAECEINSPTLSEAELGKFTSSSGLHFCSCLELVCAGVVLCSVSECVEVAACPSDWSDGLKKVHLGGLALACGPSTEKSMLLEIPVPCRDG